MIIERNVFHLKFGKAKEAIATWKEILEVGKKTEMLPSEMRLLSDLSGTSYTLVVELHLKSFIDMNPTHAVWATNEDLQTLYHKFIPLCESANREYYRIEELT